MFTAALKTQHLRASVSMKIAPCPFASPRSVSELYGTEIPTDSQLNPGSIFADGRVWKGDGMNQYAVELNQVRRTYGSRTAVDSLNLQIPRGTVCGFIGPNGSGKTTTIRMILRIIRPDSGRICVLGDDHGVAANDKVGYLPEERGLYRRMKVRTLLRYFAQLKHVRQYDREIDYWLNRLGAADWGDRRIDSLSKGMCQKVQFIAAVISRPQLLILDEPFSGLDPVSTQMLTEAIGEIRDRGTSIIFSTHDMNSAQRLCERIVMIFRGKKVLDGTPDEIRRLHPSQEIRVRTILPGTLPDRLEGVRAIRQDGEFSHLDLEPGGRPGDVLRQISEQTELEHFELLHPSLNRIFLRIAGDDCGGESVGDQLSDADRMHVEVKPAGGPMHVAVNRRPQKEEPVLSQRVK